MFDVEFVEWAFVVWLFFLDSFDFTWSVRFLVGGGFVGAVGRSGNLHGSFK